MRWQARWGTADPASGEAAGSGRGDGDSSGWDHAQYQYISRWERLESDLTMPGPTSIRPSKPDDRTQLAALHAEAWRYAYRGILPGLELERMIARRGPAWWDPRRGARHQALVAEFDGRIVGYTLSGSSRMPGTPRMGEIYELYVRPDCQGAAFGRALFEAARARLRAQRRDGLLVWALAENALACDFYAAMGGVPWLRSIERFCGRPLEKIGYHWP